MVVTRRLGDIRQHRLYDAQGVISHTLADVIPADTFVHEFLVLRVTGHKRQTPKNHTIQKWTKKTIDFCTD